MSAETHNTESEKVYFSGKQAEEIGFTKFSQRQANLQGIHTLVLDRMRIKHALPSSEADNQAIAGLCEHITVLDISGNLFESFDEIVALCGLLPKLQSLTLSYSRFLVDRLPDTAPLAAVRALSLSGTLLNEEELARVLSAFPSVKELGYMDNELSTWAYPKLCSHLAKLDLSDNNFASLQSIQRLDQQSPSLQTLVLKNNRISAVGPNAAFPSTLRELSVPDNAINAWTFFNELLPYTHINSLRVTGNPLYTGLRSADDKPLATADGYMLTIARLPQLEMLNYSKVSEKERLNAETYYLGQIAVELGQAGEGEESRIMEKHPRYGQLCDEYGEPLIQRRATTEKVDPRSLAARLVTLELRLAPEVKAKLQPRVWKADVPESFDIYAVLGMVGKRLDVPPLLLALVLETGEQDPAARDSGYGGPEWWDSSDEDGEGGNAKEEEWKTRDIALTPSTRALGTYVEGRSAMIKIRMK